MVTPAGKRKAVAHLVEAHGMSERRACKAIGCCRMTMRYQTTRADDAGIRQRMKAIAQERRRFGYRRLHVLLKREGYVINHKRLFRLYREEKLAVRRRGGIGAGNHDWPPLIRHGTGQIVQPGTIGKLLNLNWTLLSGWMLAASYSAIATSWSMVCAVWRGGTAGSVAFIRHSASMAPCSIAGRATETMRMAAPDLVSSLRSIT